MQFRSVSINDALTYNYIPDELKSDSTLIDNINNTFLPYIYYMYTYYNNLSPLNIYIYIYRELSSNFNARIITKNLDYITDYLL